MPAPIELHHAALRLSLRPDLGACIEGLWFHGTPVLRSCAPGALTSVQHSACYPLVPFSNRLANAQLHWRGSTYPLANNYPEEPHAIHGLGWQRPWQVQEASDSYALLRLQHSADPAWPFAFDATQTLRLEGDTLEMTLSLTNQAHGDAPVGLGWHPYFVKRADSQLEFVATGLWNMGRDKLPTTRSASTGLRRACAALDIDNCFDGWAGTARLQDAQLTTRLSASMQCLVVYTQPRQDCIAIEPVSHVNNAMNRPGDDAQALGIVTLAAGQSCQARMAIQVTHT